MNIMIGARHVAEGVRTELWYHHFRRTPLILAAIILAGSIIAFTGSLSNAQSANQQFVSEVQSSAGNGISVADALSSPVKVTTDTNGNQTIDNPLKYDYLTVGRAVHAIDGPLAMLGTMLDLLTFIVLPMTFIFFGAYCATYDRRAGTISLRGSRDSWLGLTAAKLGALIVTAVGTTITIVIYAVLLGELGTVSARRLVNDKVPYNLVVPESVSSIWLKLAVTLAVTILFGIVGYAVGAATNSLSWPMLAFGGLLFLLPFQGVWDPRNLLAALSPHVYDFWGQFSMRPSISVATTDAIAALVGYGLVAVVLAGVLPRRSKRYR